jgi:hypothetical protein
MESIITHTGGENGALEGSRKAASNQKEQREKPQEQCDIKRYTLCIYGKL